MGPGWPVAAVPRKGAAAVGLCRGGGSPAAQGWGVRAWGLRWGVRKGAVGSIWVEEGRRRSSTWSGRPAAVWTAAAPFQWVGAVVEGPGSTGELRGTRSRGWLGSRESGGRGSAAAYGGAAASSGAHGGFWPFKANQGGGGRWFGGRWRAALMAGRGQRLRQRHGRARWVPRRRRSASSSSCRLRRARRLSGTRQARRDGGEGGQRRACGQGAHGRAASGRAAAQRAHAGRARVPALSGQGRVSEGERERREEGSGERKPRSTV